MGLGPNLISVLPGTPSKWKFSSSYFNNLIPVLFVNESSYFKYANHMNANKYLKFHNKFLAILW